MRKGAGEGQPGRGLGADGEGEAPAVKGDSPAEVLAPSGCPQRVLSPGSAEAQGRPTLPAAYLLGARLLRSS